jgi:hypothetical protein
MIISLSVMNWKPLKGNCTRTFLTEGEGVLAAAQIMADHRLQKVMVISPSGEICGAYEVSPEGIRYAGRERQAVTASRPCAS